MALSPEEVKKIAHLARLEVNEEELQAIGAKLSSIVALAEQMQTVNTDHILPMSHPLDLQQRLREDTVTLKDQRDAFQSIAPATEAGLYLVPKVIE